MSTSDRVGDALIVAGVGIGVLLVVRALLTWLLNRVVERLARRSGTDAPRLRTQVFLIRRLAVLVVGIVVIWNVLDQFPAMHVVAQTLLASSAVIALFVGIAVQTPLSNLGSGLLLALTQPVRLGDRASVGEHTGLVEEITSIHTVLLTDDDRRVFIPNERMISTPIENRTIIDPRRGLRVRVPMRIDGAVGEGRGAVEAATAAALDAGGEFVVRCVEATETVVWLEIDALLAPGTHVAQCGSELREAALDALRGRELLPPPVA